jgi:lipoprotein-releasing system permease protein
MKLRLIFRIARSLLLARWKQTLLAAIGVTFGITMFIALLSFMAGLNDLLDGIMLNRTAHIRIFNEIKPNIHQPINISTEFVNSYNFIRSVKSGSSRQEIYNSGAIMQALKKDERVAGISPKITAPVFFADGSVDITGIISGIDVQAESRLFHFSEYVMAGNPLDINNIPNSIILGKGLAEKLLAGIGDVIQIITVKQDQFPLKVVGLFESGIQELDKVQSYASFGTTQKIIGKPNDYVTDIQVKLKDINKAPLIAIEYAKLFQADAEDIQTANAQFETGSFIRTLISYSVGITLLIVAGFGIYNILNMMIYEKMDSIAILKAIGFSGSDVNHIFLVIALSIGIVGGILGLLFGFLFSFLIDQIPFVTASLPTIRTYPINYNPVFYFIGSSFSIVTTYLAGWAPARKASRIDPVIIIRGK